MNDDEINNLLKKRSEYRKNRQYSEADSIKETLITKVPGIRIVDIPLKQGGGSTWHVEVVLPSDVSLIELSKKVFLINDPTSDDVAALVQEAKRYCQLCREYRGKYEDNLRPTDAQGRQWADAAFNFAMGGVYDEDLYIGLVDGARAEMLRIGARKCFGSLMPCKLWRNLRVLGY